MPVYEQRIVSMTAEQWAALEAFAVRLDAIATRGPHKGESSWHRLIEKIASGELVVITPLHKAKLKPAPELA